MNATIVIAIGIIVVIALVVWMLTAAARKEAKKKKQEISIKLEQLAAQDGRTLGDIDFLGRRAIATDTSGQAVYYVDNSELVMQQQGFAIADATGCSLVQSGSRHIENARSGKTKVEEHISNIQLLVTLRGGTQVSLHFYDEVKDGILELLPLREKAKHWNGIIKG
ncbi:MAG: hypothetical protein JNL72_06640 [Flavipsychrobacter sp.]|nr:hypothetical protein [Flavipsychrobacter sp.]